MKNNFGSKLIYLRKKRQMTQDELAGLIGVSRQAVSKWERDEASPDLYNIKAIARVFNISTDELLNDTYQEQRSTSNNYNNATNYIKKLLYKAKHTTNSKEAKKIKKILITAGIIGIVVGGLMTISGFIGFGQGAMNSVNTMSPFNPLPYIGLFLLGAPISGISVYILIAGLSIFVAETATNYLDTRNKCPKCGDEIDSDENVCSNCGYNIKQSILCDCGKENQLTDKFCRECGKPLKNTKSNY